MAGKEIVKQGKLSLLCGLARHGEKSGSVLSSVV